MAAFKFVFLILSAVLLASQVQAQPTEFQDLQGPSSLILLLKKIVNAVEALVERVLVILSFVGIIEIDPAAAVQILVDAVQERVGQILDTINNVLAKIAEDSSDAGKKLAQCVISGRNGVFNVTSDLVQDYSNCLSDDIVKIINDIGPLLIDLIGLNEQAKQFIAKLNKCNDDIRSIVCVENALEKLIVNVIDNISPVLIKDLPPVTADISALKVAAAKCWTLGLPNLFGTAAKVLDNIASCVLA